MERQDNMGESQMPKNSMKGLADIRADIDPLNYPGRNPMSADDHNRMTELENTQTLLYCLREIAENSEDAESTRVAFIALTTTAAGQAYLEGNPIKL